MKITIAIPWRSGKPVGKKHIAIGEEDGFEETACGAPLSAWKPFELGQELPPELDKVEPCAACAKKLLDALKAQGWEQFK